MVDLEQGVGGLAAILVAVKGFDIVEGIGRVPDPGPQIVQRRGSGLVGLYGDEDAGVGFAQRLEGGPVAALVQVRPRGEARLVQLCGDVFEGRMVLIGNNDYLTWVFVEECTNLSERVKVVDLSQFAESVAQGQGAIPFVDVEVEESDAIGKLLEHGWVLIR